MPAIDPYALFVDSPQSCARNEFAVTPHDTNELTYLTAKGIICDVAGTITGIIANGSVAFSFEALAGVHYPYVFKIIKSTGTDASGIKGFY